MRSVFPVALVAGLLVSCATPNEPPAAGPERLKVEVVATHPGDPTAFTQGVEVATTNPDELIVGTGWWGESRIERRRLDGSVIASQPLQPQEFGEGITQFDDTIWQLTWKNGVAYQRDARSLAITGQATFPGEGWGLCARSDSLIMSDGSSQLRILDPVTFAEKGRLETGVDKLNELECTDDAIYANQFMSTTIVRFDANGKVTALIDAAALPNRATPNPNNVLNGIAHIPGTDRFYLTGKRWPDVYEVRFVPVG